MIRSMPTSPKVLVADFTNTSTIGSSVQLPQIAGAAATKGLRYGQVDNQQQVKNHQLRKEVEHVISAVSLPNAAARNGERNLRQFTGSLNNKGEAKTTHNLSQDENGSMKYDRSTYTLREQGEVDREREESRRKDQ